MTIEANEARGSAMPLLCRLGRHIPRRLPIWNDGYYFSNCRRCNRDIVRSLNGGWQVPSGYRVVWQPARPQGEQMPTLTQDAAPVSGPVPVSEPVSGASTDEAPLPAAVTTDEPGKPDHDVTGDAPAASDPGAIPQQDDQADAPSTQTPPPDPLDMPAARAPRSQRSSIPDFMDDARYAPRSPEENGPRDGASTPPLLARGVREELDRIGLANLAAMSNRVFSRVRTPADAGGNRPSFANLNRVAWAVAAVLIVFFATHNASWWGKTEPAASIAPSVVAQRAPGASAVPPGVTDITEPPATVAIDATPPDPEAPIASGQRDRPPRPLARADRVSGATVNEMVVASILNCRAGPAVTAPVTTKMVRGAVVTTSARQGEWAYVTHRGRSCWAQSRMLQR